MTENRHKYDYIEDLYENLAVLGHGGENVYVARNKVTGKIVVKKYVAPQVIGVYERLKNRDEKSSGLHTGCETLDSGNGIPRIYELACDGKSAVVIEAYISGETLEEAMESRGTFGEEEAKDVICSLLIILKDIHRQGLVHRDISAKNVMLTDEGTVKLIDFGIAREVKVQKPCDTAILGTVGYAAPEQFGFRQSDARTDIYAVGVLFNQLLTGHMPIEQIYSDRRFKKIIEKSTAIDADQRYANAEKMLAALRRAGSSMRITGIQMLPGFRTGTKWKRWVACAGYGFMGIYTYASLEEFAGIPVGFFAEMAALTLYWWLATLLAANIGYWDQIVYPICNWSRGKRIAVRVGIWMVLFYAGASLEMYIRNLYLKI